MLHYWQSRRESRFKPTSLLRASGGLIADVINVSRHPGPAGPTGSGNTFVSSPISSLPDTSMWDGGLWLVESTWSHGLPADWDGVLPAVPHASSECLEVRLCSLTKLNLACCPRAVLHPSVCVQSLTHPSPSSSLKARFSNVQANCLSFFSALVWNFAFIL